MAATDRPDGSEAQSKLAQRIKSDEFVTLHVAPSVPSLVATRVLTSAFDARDIPYQARISTDIGDVTLCIGTYDVPVTGIHIEPDATVDEVRRIARELDVDVANEDVAPGTVFWDAIETTDSALGIPREAIDDGLAHSTLVHGSFSGDIEALNGFLEGVDTDDRTAVMSAITLGALANGGSRTAPALERLLASGRRSDGPFASVAGEADVFDVLCEADPGIALAIACGRSTLDDGMDRWRTVANSVHEAVRTAHVDPSANLVSIDTSCVAPSVVSRLVFDYRTDAEAVLVTGPDHVGLTSTRLEEVLDDIEEITAWIVRHSPRRVTVAGDPSDIESRLREVIE